MSDKTSLTVPKEVHSKLNAVKGLLQWATDRKFTMAQFLDFSADMVEKRIKDNPDGIIQDTRKVPGKVKKAKRDAAKAKKEESDGVESVPSPAPTSAVPTVAPAGPVAQPQA